MSDTETATFAGGCFWCMEPPFEGIGGVEEVVVGYTGGHVEEPTYEEVCSGTTGHLEAARVTFDPEKISYRELLWVFWRNIDPTDAGGQFADRGSQYRTAIFVHDEEQRAAAEESRRELEASGRLDGPVATEVREAGEFWPAEQEHQDFHEKRPARYRTYHAACGRPERLEELWGEKAGKGGASRGGD